MASAFEQIQATFAANARCKLRASASPKLNYDGCYYIECEHSDCRCRLIDGDNSTATPFLTRWQKRQEG